MTLWRGEWTYLKGTNTYNDIVVRVRMNSIKGGVPQPDGLLAVTVNGVTRQLDNMVWRTRDALHVSSLYFETFFGGDDDSWATPDDTYTYFKSMSLQKLA